MASGWFSKEQYWGKPWMNYCTFLLISSFISDFKDCQHRESISLYNVHNYRALVQHWKVEQRHNSFLCLLVVFGFGCSFTVKPQNWSTAAFSLSLLIYIYHRWCRHTVRLGQRICLKYFLSVGSKIKCTKSAGVNAGKHSHVLLYVNIVSVNQRSLMQSSLISFTMQTCQGSSCVS